MEHTERQEQILAYMETRQFATVAELASLIFASEATVRREIRHLEERGCLKSVYGGVVAAKYGMEPVPISMRDGANSAQKEHLAERAALTDPLHLASKDHIGIVLCHKINRV